MDEIPDETLLLPDGRTVSYAIYGLNSPTAPTVIYLHGFPGSHHEAYLSHDSATQNGVRLIAISRPGSSASTFTTSHSIVSYPADVLAVADALGVQRFCVIGVSGGGPYAISCLRSIKRDRLAGVGLVAPLMPLSLGTEGMLVKTRVMLNVAPWATGLLGWVMERQVGSAARDTSHPEKFEKLMDSEFAARPESDREMWHNHPTMREVLLRCSREAFAQEGSYPVAWEARLFGSPWGFELGDVQAEEGRCVLWHGDQDVNVPYAMAVKAVGLMRGVELRTLEGDSHMTVVTRTGGVFGDYEGDVGGEVRWSG